MDAVEHYRVAERLLTASAKGHIHLAEQGSVPASQLEANLRVIDQQIAMAHVHALLARG